VEKVASEESEVFAEPCDRCGTPIPSNCDRSPNYCDECAVIVVAQGGDECSRQDTRVGLVKRADEILAGLERVLAQNETAMAQVTA
jgi:hypothetical protein